jgi:hypothetical protein
MSSGTIQAGGGQCVELNEGRYDPPGRSVRRAPKPRCADLEPRFPPARAGSCYDATLSLPRVPAKVSSPFRLQTFFIVGRQRWLFEFITGAGFEQIGEKNSVAVV